MARRFVALLGCSLSIAWPLAACGKSTPATRSHSTEASPQRSTTPARGTRINAPTIAPAQRRRELNLVQSLVTDIVTSSDARDPSLCTRVFTLDYLRKTTGLRVRRAIAACRRQVASSTGRVKLVQIERVDLRRAGDRITGQVQYLERADGTLARAILLIRSRGAAYRVYGGLPAAQPGQPAAR